MNERVYGTTKPIGNAEPITLSYHDRQGLGGICLKNWILGMLTLGIYRFWAKTEVRRHIWSNIKINGEPLEYTGKGVELLLGAILIFFIIFLPYLLLVFGLQFAGMESASIVVQGLFSIVFLLLIGMAIYRAWRYRLSRTLWRGIRGTLVGSSFKYSLIYFGALLAGIFSLGWSNPAMNLKLQGKMTNDMRFGETPFYFNEDAKAPYKQYAIAWFSMIGIGAVIGLGIAFNENFPSSADAIYDTIAGNSAFSVIFVLAAIAAFFAVIAFIGFIWSVYIAAALIVYAKNTAFDRATFHLNATGWSLAKLFFVNMAITIFSLGIAAPIATQRTVRYMVNRLEVEGVVDISKIKQSSAPLSKTGEGMLDAFDIDGI